MADHLPAETVHGAVVIADVVGSRRHRDRAGLQRRLGEAIAAANREERWRQPLQQTLGDEFQGAAGDLRAALRLGLDLRLTLLPAVDLRLGIGVGSWQVFDPAASPVSQDGPAWWAGRQAVEEVKALASRSGTRHVRTRALPAEGHPVNEVNGFLELQDFIVAGMSERQLRLLTGLLAGRPQRVLAQAERVSQSAVSQALRTSGAAALVHALETSVARSAED